MASAPHGDLEVAVAGEAHRCSHVGRATAAGDQSRVPIDIAVPDRTGGVVVGVVGADEVTPGIRGDLKSWPVLTSVRLLRGGVIAPPGGVGRKSAIWTWIEKSGLHRRPGARDTRLVRTYGQYCPIARGAEIFAERWTPLIIRNLHLGCETFGEILDGAPGLSWTLLAQRLRELERLGIVESAPKAHGRGQRHRSTSSGHDLFRVCETLGEWGARWLEIAPEDLDPYVALWSMCNALRPDRLPDRRVVVRLDFTGYRPHERYWLGPSAGRSSSARRMTASTRTSSSPPTPRHS